MVFHINIPTIAVLPAPNKTSIAPHVKKLDNAHPRVTPTMYIGSTNIKKLNISLNLNSTGPNTKGLHAIVTTKYNAAHILIFVNCLVVNKGLFVLFVSIV